MVGDINQIERVMRDEGSGLHSLWVKGRRKERVRERGERERREGGGRKRIALSGHTERNRIVSAREIKRGRKNPRFIETPSISRQ